MTCSKTQKKPKISSKRIKPRQANIHSCKRQIEKDKYRTRNIDHRDVMPEIIKTKQTKTNTEITTQAKICIGVRDK